MRWEDEQYVRWYRRNTPEWLVMSWQARGLFGLILREVDRAGTLPLGRLGPKAVAVAVRAQWGDIEGALDELLRDGCVTIRDTTLVIPNFLEAQTAIQSDRARQQRSRETARAKALSGSIDVTPRDSDVTWRDDKNTPRDQNVTDGHALSRTVTECHSDLICEELRQTIHTSDPDPPDGGVGVLKLEPPSGPEAVPRKRGPRARAGKEPDPRVSRILDHYQKLGEEFGRVGVRSPRLIAMVKARLGEPIPGREPFTVDEGCAALDELHASSFHRGEEPGHTKVFLGIEQVFRSQERMAKWVEDARRSGRLKTGNAPTKKERPVPKVTGPCVHCGIDLERHRPGACDPTDEVALMAKRKAMIESDPALMESIAQLEAMVRESEERDRAAGSGAPKASPRIPGYDEELLPAWAESE